MEKLIVSCLALTGCTDAFMSSASQLGTPQHVVCYSGGKVIYDGHSTGVIHNESQSDGFYFKSKETGKAVQVNGDCVITEGDSRGNI